MTEARRAPGPNPYAADRFDEPGDFLPKKSIERIRAKMAQCSSAMSRSVGNPYLLDHYGAAVDVLRWALGEIPSPGRGALRPDEESFFEELSFFRPAHYADGMRPNGAIPRGFSYPFCVNAYKALLWLRFPDDDPWTVDGGPDDPADV